jgi:hypothetical protein
MKWLYTSRFAEIAVTFGTWAIVTIPLWLAPFFPIAVSYGIIAFHIYFLYQATQTAVNAVRSCLLIREKSRIDFAARLQGNFLSRRASSIHHLLVIPTYKESVEKLAETIECITKNHYPYHHNLHVVLGFEKRERQAPEKEAMLRARFGSSIDLLATYHELQPHEISGKASNQTWATRFAVEQLVKPRGIAPSDVIVTTCDADSKLPHNYFAYLTYEFLNDPDRLKHFYWAPVVLYSNFWKLPFFVRMQATLSSIVRLAYLQDKQNLIQISTYSTSLSLLQDIGYWDVDIIPEDWHAHLQAFFTHGPAVKTIPLYTIINGDAVYAGSLLPTFLSRYEQEKRWAWGVSDIAYAWRRLWETPHIPLWPKISKIFFLLKNHLLWPTSFFILTVFATIVPLINPVFKRSVLGFILPQISGFILTVSSSMLIVYTLLDIHIRRRLSIETKPQSFLILAMQWYILPVVSFVLSCLPALEAHTRMLLGKKLQYKVTEKK